MQAMLCNNTATLCSANSSLIPDYTDNYNDSYNATNESATTNYSDHLTTVQHDQIGANNDHSRHVLHAALDQGTVTAILFLSVLVFISCCLLMLGTHWTGGGRCVTSVFLRSLCISDMLMSIYGLFKMTMVLYLDRLTINFFLPESLFFTASFACTMSLLFLNMDCSMKLAKPQQFRQVDKDTVITVMLLMWNAAFIVGFLPLIGWNQDDNTVHFFSFYPWHYLFFNGCINFICVIVCVCCMVSVKRFHKNSQLDYDYFSTRILEFHNYRHLHDTVIADSALWLCCYLPFFLYISLACQQCLLSDSPNQDTAVIYFIPIFLLKSLLSSALQACRTLNAYAVVSQLLLETSVVKHIRQRTRELRRQPKDSEVVAISYSNPLCEFNNVGSDRDNHILLNRNQLQHRFSEVEFAELLRASEFYSNTNNTNTTLTGISNGSFRTHVDTGRPKAMSEQETTVV